MLGCGSEIRYHIATILAAHWWEFVGQYRRWIRPVVFENVRRVLSCRTAALGCHVYACPTCSHVELVPHSCKSRFCPTCGKHATDVWADEVLNRLLDVPYHHLVLSIPWQLRVVILVNREAGLNLLFSAAAEAIQQWARDVRGQTSGSAQAECAHCPQQNSIARQLALSQCEAPPERRTSKGAPASLIQRSVLHS